MRTVLRCTASGRTVALGRIGGLAGLRERRRRPSWEPDVVGSRHTHARTRGTPGLAVPLCQSFTVPVLLFASLRPQLCLLFGAFLWLTSNQYDFAFCARVGGEHTGAGGAPVLRGSGLRDGSG